MPEPAQLADPADDLGREAPGALVLVDERRDLGGHEVADRVAQEDVLGREVEVHALERTPAGSRARTPVQPGPGMSGSLAAMPAGPMQPGCRPSRARGSIEARPGTRKARSTGTPRRPSAATSWSSSAGRAVLAGPAGDAPRREPHRRPPAAPRARGRPARHAPDRAPRRRPAAPPVRRHARRPGPLPVELRRPRRGPAGRDRGGRRRRPHRPGLRRPPAPVGDRSVQHDCRSTRRPTRRWSTASASWRSIQADTATSPTRSSTPTARSACASTTARSSSVARRRRPPARPSWSSSARSSGADVVRESHIASGDRCCTYRVVDRTS